MPQKEDTCADCCIGVWILVVMMALAVILISLAILLVKKVNDVLHNG
jgi:hypothetical protein